MKESTLFNLTVTFALVTGTGAGLLSLLTWEIFRRSPFGRVVFSLSIFTSVFVLYHAVLLVVQAHPLAADLLRSLAYTALVVIIGLLARVQRRLSARQREVESG